MYNVQTRVNWKEAFVKNYPNWTFISFICYVIIFTGTIENSKYLNPYILKTTFQAQCWSLVPHFWNFCAAWCVIQSPVPLCQPQVERTAPLLVASWAAGWQFVADTILHHCWKPTRTKFHVSVVTKAKLNTLKKKKSHYFIKSMQGEPIFELRNLNLSYTHKGLVFTVCNVEECTYWPTKTHTHAYMHSFLA